jgi:VWFA-related protein
MREAMRHRVMLLGVVLPALLAAQQPDPQMPRFRAGANLVRVDAYVSSGDVPLTDLTVDDFAVYEDDKPQKVESFELIRARGAVPESQRPDVNNTRDMRQQVADAARVFTLFFDPFYTGIAGSYYLQKPLVDTLNKVIGPDDMIGAMTPFIEPSMITYSKRSESIEEFVTKYWMWGSRDVRWPVIGKPEKGRPDSTVGLEEASIWDCYPTPPKANAGIARAMVARLRERRTLDALEALVQHLEGLRQERKFVMIFTEGWPLFGPDPSLSRVLEGRGPLPDPITVDPATGRIRPQGQPIQGGSAGLTMNECERLRIELSQINHERDFLLLLQRANRANVSFYPVDARGLLVFDQPTNFDLLPSHDQAILQRRHDFLKDMALQTDGHAVLNTGHVTEGLTKIFRDVGSYYLMSYYSTNQRLDGRFRRIRVDVKRPGANVRARPGYLAPTEAEARAASTAIERAVASGPPPTVARALDALVPTRGNLPVRIQAIGARNSIRAIVELDAATVKQPEWMSGGTLRVTFEPEKAAGESGAPQTLTLAVEPGQRSIVINGPERPLTAGRYTVRAELTPRNSRLPIQAITATTVPVETAEVGTGGLASRRGPSTGLAYIATADPRFRRTERLRVEVPLAGDGFTGTGRLLTREGQPTPLVVSFTTRTDTAAQQRFGTADVTLSALAEGEYVLELSVQKNGATEVVAYGFRIVP